MGIRVCQTEHFIAALSCPMCGGGGGGVVVNVLSGISNVCWTASCVFFPLLKGKK